MQREAYLNHCWRPYPELPGDAVHRGRLVDVRENELALWRNGAITRVPINAAGSVFADGAAATVTDILIPGDLVSISGSEVSRVTLLAPWRTSGVFRAFTSERLRQWNAYLAAVRAFFVGHGFTEVPTPSLVACPGTEPSLDVFATDLVHGSKRQRLYLPTSPELHLKKALARGLEKIFEIKNCFRNGERTEHHRAEFSMLEWYRAWEKPAALHRDLEQLFEFLGDRLGDWHPRNPRRIVRLSMAEVFRQTLGETITPESTADDYAAIARRAGLDVTPNLTIDDLFFLIFTERIENHFDRDDVTLVDRWPPFQAALARLTPEGWADRFEIYWQGLELANAFHELNDPAVQRERFAADLAKKVAWGKDPVPLDEDFLKALDSGVPPSSGIALGVDRLFMALFAIENIAELRFFET